jgi:hypothetical protein
VTVARRRDTKVTVKELMEFLKTQPEDRMVFYHDHEYGPGPVETHAVEVLTREVFLSEKGSDNPDSLLYGMRRVRTTVEEEVVVLG